MKRTSVVRFLLLAPLLALAGCTPSLHDLIGRGDVARVRALLEEDPARVADVNELGKQPLQYAAMYKQLDAMEALVAAGADVNAADGTGMTALQMAVFKGWEEGVVWLIEHGADLEQRDQFGDLSSHTAAIWGQGGMIGLLAERGVSLTAKNNAGLTPLDLARKYRHGRTAQRIAMLADASGENS